MCQQILKNRLEVEWLDRSSFENGPPDTYSLFFKLSLLLWFINCWPLNTESFRTCKILLKIMYEWMHYSLLNFNPFLPIGHHIPRIFTKLFWKAANCCLLLFKTVLCKSEKFSNQEEGNCTFLSSKELCKFKRLWCEAAKNRLFQ